MQRGNCQACKMEANGVKSRLPLQHTCERLSGISRIYKPLTDATPTGKKCIAQCSLSLNGDRCECYPNPRNK